MKAEVKPAALSQLERESIEYFISFVQLLGMPKSIGEIYGLLFVSTGALSMDDIVDRLRISKGSASGGLSLLRELGAVQRVYVEGDRRDHFAPDFDLARIVSVFFRQKLHPRLENGADRLERMESFAAATAEQSENGDDNDVLIRVRALQAWQARGRKILPLLLKFLRK